MATFPPSTVIPAPSRLTSANCTTASIHAAIAIRTVANANIEHSLQSLPSHYPEPLARYYDLMMQGHRQSAQILARQIPAGFHPSSIMDLGTGTGLTAIEVCKAITANRPIMHIAVLDGNLWMLQKAIENIQREMVLNRTITLLIKHHEFLCILRDVHDIDGIRTAMATRPPPQLITAQRQLITIKKEKRVQTLQAWMAMTSDGGKLIVDVPHPNRCIGLEWMGKNGNPDIHLGPEHEYCFQLADEQTWNECKDYAHELAEHANLSIEGTMIPQRPQTGIVNELPMLEAWISQRRPLTMTGSLSREEVNYFRIDYTSQNDGYYKSLGYQIQYEIAAVIVVFSRRSVSAEHAASTQH